MRMSLSHGFTLIETLIYLALFMLLMTGIISSFFAVSQSSADIATDALLHDEGLWILDSIRNSWEANSYSGAVPTPKTSRVVRLVNFHVGRKEDSTLINFDLTSTTTVGFPRTESFSEVLYSLP